MAVESHRKTSILLFRFIKPYHYPVGLSIFSVLACASGYAISVSEDKIHYLFPYISSTGATAPASCYFGLFLNLAAIFTFGTVYYRHLYLEKFNIALISSLPLGEKGAYVKSNGNSNSNSNTINDVSFFLGTLSALGMMIAANFQTSQVKSIHFIGAALIFVVGGIYCGIQAYCTYIGNHKNSRDTDGRNYKKLFIIRLFLVIGISVNFAVALIGMLVAINQIDGDTSGTMLHWSPHKKGYTMHMVSVFAEWLMAICFICSMLTFVGDLKRIDQASPSRKSTLSDLEIHQLETEKPFSPSNVQNNVVNLNYEMEVC